MQRLCVNYTQPAKNWISREPAGKLHLIRIHFQSGYDVTSSRMFTIVFLAECSVCEFEDAMCYENAECLDLTRGYTCYCRPSYDRLPNTTGINVQCNFAPNGVDYSTQVSICQFIWYERSCVGHVVYILGGKKIEKIEIKQVLATKA